VLGALCSAALLAVLVMAPAQAVHTLALELDGDTDVDAGGPAFDWESFFDAAGAERPLPTDFTDSGFEKDFVRQNGVYVNRDDTTYATGSKDTLSISPGWQCNRDNNVNDKIDITNAYAAVYTAPATTPDVTAGDEILYFALERFANDGDANVGFWFLQNNVTCASPGGNTPFTGDHREGDILVVSAFTKGGVVSTIDAYQWVGNDNTGHIDPDPIAHGVDCKSNQTPSNDTTCATVNTETIDPPWDNVNKRGTEDVRRAEFFEGGLNITKAGLGGQCFNTFLGDTRSSQSLTATLFDYASGKLGQCTVSMTTKPSQTTRQLGSTDPITDTADVLGATSGSGTAPTPTGAVTFFLCGPGQLTPPDNGICATGGTQVGDPVTTTEKVAGTATAESADASSLITGLGKYCFRARFVADPNDPFYAGQTADTLNPTEECFTVTGQAGLATAQDWLPNDTATLTGPGTLSGTLTFTLYTGDNCGKTSGATVAGQQYTVNVTNAASGSKFSTSNETFTVEAADAGSYSWLVHYDDNVLADPADRCETSTLSITD
jgi:hypothetical protein